MAKTYLETNTINFNYQFNSYENVLSELNREIENREQQNKTLSAMWENAAEKDAEAELHSQFAPEVMRNEAEVMLLQNERKLLAKYPDEFPVLYSMRRSEEDGVQFEMREVLAETPDIVTEMQDVLPKEEQLEMVCTLDGAGSFGIQVEPYDKAGEDSTQMRAKINFSQKAIDDLNEARLKQILEFCEKRGLSIYDLVVPWKDGLIDLDEKLAQLTQKVLESREREQAENPGPDPQSDNQDDFIILADTIRDVDLSRASLKSGKTPKTFDSVKEDFLNFIEGDMKKTRGLSYFEHIRIIDGKSTLVYSIYDKPNRDNEKLDGLPDKNKGHVPTYSYRFYAAQDPQNGNFVFGYATPGGKKMDDVAAGDLIGVIKKSGITHLNFANLPNHDKMVWLIACAEKGIVPVGISINLAKAKSMVEAARKKLTDEEFASFKRYLSEQLIENAKKKCTDETSKTFGLNESEFDYIQSLRASYDFENFRLAYENDNGLYQEVIKQIDLGSKDSKKGAATTFGAMQTLRTVFDIYYSSGYETIGEFLKAPELEKYNIGKAEKAQLAAIPASKKMTELTTADFMLMYNTLLPKHVANAEKDILEALTSEDNGRVHRADKVVLSSDVFPRYKGALNEINIMLHQKRIDALTLPNEHKGLSYEYIRPNKAKQAEPVAKVRENDRR